MRFSLLLPLVFSAPVFCAQGSNFNVSKEVAAQYGCGDLCYADFQAGNVYDVDMFGTNFDFDFYATASNFSSSKPGDLLKFKPIDPAGLVNITYGITAYKIQYTSVNLEGKNVPATGFIVIPYANARNGHKYRTVAFAHGTSGVFSGCAPSTQSMLYDYNTWTTLAYAGYAVIATDYSGLGNNYTEHEYIAFPAQANDLYYSVVAARQILGHVLTNEWMSFGHSEGGGAAWSLAESKLIDQNPSPAGRYLGTVANAPATRLYDMAQLGLTQALALNSNGSSLASVQGVIAEIPFLAFGLHRTIAGDSFAWVGAKLKQRLQLAQLAQACFYAIEALVLDLGVADYIDLNSTATLFGELQQLQNRTAPGTGRNKQPILVTQGLADASILPPITIQTWKDSCALGNEVHLQLYPKLDHTPILGAGAPHFLLWMADRFNGVPTTGCCTNVTVTPFDPLNMFAPPDQV